MHAPFDSTDSSFFFQTNYTNMSKVLCLTSVVYTNILVTSLIALKTETHKWPCNPILHCVLSAKHCHRQQSQTPTGTELNSCLACLALIIASWPRKLNGCFWEGVSVSSLCCPLLHCGPGDLRLLVLRPSVVFIQWLVTRCMTAVPHVAFSHNFPRCQCLLLKHCFQNTLHLYR